LTQWTKQSDFRGLERWASIKLRQSAEEACDSTRQIVAISKLLNADDFSERYRKAAKASNVYARLMGIADAVALEREEQKHEQLAKMQRIGSVEKLACRMTAYKKH
jgi:hypothetical protein